MTVSMSQLQTNALKQQIFRSDEIQVFNKVLPESMINNNGNKYHFVVYIEDTTPRPIIYLSGNERLYEFADNHSFLDRVLELPAIHFDSLLLLSTFFRPFVGNNIFSLIRSKNSFHSMSILDEFLSDTNGYILYTHQLEILIGMLANLSYQDAIVFRKEWNKKKPSARSMAASIPIEEHTSLLDLLESRTIAPDHFVFHANFRGAFQLYNYLNS